MSRSGIYRKAARPAAFALAAGLVLTGFSSFAPAAQLDEKTCQQMKQEITQLEGLGARENFAKGAQWGKANLRQAQLDQVKSLIEMDETVAFRCPRPKPVAPPADPAAAAVKGKAPGKAMAKVLPKPPQAPKTKAQTPADPAAPRPKAKPKAAAGGPADGKAPAAAAAATPAKPRPKQPTQAQTAKPAAPAQ